jgi:4-amino-4-deoxy-L-arabinose transferase-like glycosyltransferase
LFRGWRCGVYLKALLVATAAALPWILVWPAALYLRDEALFMRWFWDNNFGRYLGFVALGPPAKDLFWLRTFPWVTFPVFPLVLWTLWRRGRETFANDGVRLALVVSVVGWGVLFAAHTARDLYAMPLLAPLAVIAAGAVTRLPGWAVRGGYWFSAVLFGLFAALAWGIWLHGLIEGHPPRVDLLARHLPMDFAPTWRWGALLGAAVLQMGWVWVLLRFRPPRPGALLAWPAGLILGWGLVAALHLPWIDAAKSYRGVFEDLARVLPDDYDCVADLREMRLRECERGMLHYVAGVTTRHIAHPDETECSFILVEARVRTHGTGVDLGPGWRRIWEGRRANDRRDLFILFQRTGSAPGGPD